MTPTQKNLIELAREAGFGIGQGISAIRINGYADDLLRLAELLLERFGAGGGEPFGYFCDWGDHDGLQRIAMYYGEPGSATFDDWNEYPKVHKNLPLYTHPSTTDLRAEYERGLDDAARVAADDAHVVDGRGYYDQLGDAKLTAANIRNAIEALKGKQ